MNANDDSRLKILLINKGQLISLLTSYRVQTRITNLPADVVIKEVQYRVAPQGWELLIWSSEFEPVEPGQYAPLFMAHIEALDTKKD